MTTSVGTRVGIVGILALAAVIAVTQSDSIWRWNQPDPDAESTVKISDSPSPKKELKFKVTLRGHYPLGEYRNPASTAIHWAIGDPPLSQGYEKPKKARWERQMDKYPTGTKFWLVVEPGNKAKDDATTQVWVYVNDVEVCGPVIDGNRVPIYDPRNLAFTKGKTPAECVGYVP